MNTIKMQICTMPMGTTTPLPTPNIDTKKTTTTTILEQHLEKPALQTSIERSDHNTLGKPPSHATGRPQGDNRTAQQVIDGSPALQHFLHTKLPKETLTSFYQKVGDFSENNRDPKSRADAMYNLLQVISYITSGTDSRASHRPGLPITEGHFAGQHHPVKNTNYELFNNFLINGYSALKDPALNSNNNEKDGTAQYNKETKAPDTVPDRKKTQAPPTTTPVTSNTDTKRPELDTDVAPTGPTGRPEGDNRSAEQLLKENLKIVNSRPSTISDEALIKLVGDFTPNNPDPNSRADAAYNLARLLHYVDSIQTYPGIRALMIGAKTHHKYKNNEKIDGQFDSPLPLSSPRVHRGFEAAILYRVITEESYAALPSNKSEFSKKKLEKDYPEPKGLTVNKSNYIVTI